MTTEMKCPYCGEEAARRVEATKPGRPAEYLCRKCVKRSVYEFYPAGALVPSERLLDGALVPTLR